MACDITIKIGGEAGQGIQTVGQLLALVCREAGLHVLGINDFESRIRGGHSFFQLRIADHPLTAPHHRVHMLIAMDRRTLELHQSQLVSDGLCILNQEPDATGDSILHIPFDRFAREAGNPVAANTVAAGTALSLLGAPSGLLGRILEQQFATSRRDMLQQNLTAARKGAEAVASITFTHALNWNGDRGPHLLLDGSQALALGALSGDCRFAAFYPMSPATGIMLHLAACQEAFPLVVEQAEDEIAAINMIIGAAAAGARSLTATSGGGFCLMTEGLGYAGIAEIPIVIINAQRPGPATGLPTRTAQGDLQFVLHAGQDDFPRFVFAPGSVAEAYAIAARALDLAERFQTPAIILVDQYLNDTLCVSDSAFTVPDTVPRHVHTGTGVDNPEAYHRYTVTESGVSPMVLPCGSPALVKISGNEHSQDGHISEDAGVRAAMVAKRERKIGGMLAHMHGPEQSHPDAAIKVLGWGSTRGAILEAVQMLRAGGTDADAVHFCDLWPFPAAQAVAALQGFERLYIVEQNSAGQFARLLRQETGLQAAAHIRTCDGRPLYPIDIFTTITDTIG